MGDKGSLRERILKLLQGRPASLKVEPRHRTSGPAVRPIDWYKPDIQARLCQECKKPTVAGSQPLWEGKWCGLCYAAMGKMPEPPDAA